MHNNILKRIFDFLEEKGEHRAPVKWKLINNIPLKKEELNVKGDLNLAHSNITSLPKGLKVGGDLLIEGTFLTEYTRNELREMIKPGFIKGEMYN